MTSSTRRTLILAATILGVSGAACLGGWLYGRHTEGLRADAAEQATATARDDARAAAEQATARQTELRAETEAVRQELVQAQRRAASLEARRSCTWALDALDARNFGIAQSYVDDVATRTNELPNLTDQHSAATALRILTAGNLEDQRASLRGLCQSIDRALPRPEDDADGD